MHWLDHVRATYLLIAQDCELVFNGQISSLYWYMETAKAIALLTRSAHGFAIWQKLVQLNAVYGKPAIPAIQPETPTPQPPAVELKVTPREFVDIAGSCLKIAYQLRLHGENAVRGTDQATAKLTGWNPRQLMGIVA